MFEVEVNPETFVRNHSGQITGVIFLRVLGVEYPDNRWNDFVVVVLEWWLREALRVPECDELSFRFMDGPFRFSLTKAKHARYHIRLEGMPNQDAKSGIVSTTEFVRQLCRAAAATLRTCEANGWDSEEVRALKATLEGVVTHSTH